MKIAIIGSRGIPARYGGFETFVEHISSILVRANYEVTVYGEKGNAEIIKNNSEVHIKESVFKKSKNPLLFYFDSLRKTVSTYDLVLVCGVGAAPFYPLFKNKNSFLITNVDGLEHLRAKFSIPKKIFVRLAQRFTKKYSDIIIADSESVGIFWKEKLLCPPEKLEVIAYGADEAFPFNQAILEKYSLIEGNYYLIVARLVPENHILEIIKGFIASGSEKKLIIVGGLESNSYVRMIREFSGSKILFADAIYEKESLDSLRRGAFAYIHGHSVGGTNPSLLEAMAASCICICHDNIFNREVNTEEQLYFRDAEDLRLRINELEKMPKAEIALLKQTSFKRVSIKYSWDLIGEQYLQLLREIYERKHHI